MIVDRDEPILWHIMKWYASWGHIDFILCLGHRAAVVKDFFPTYNEALANDFGLSNGGRDVEFLGSDISDWRVTFVDTGVQSSIASACDVSARYLGDDASILATYGDGATDVPLDEIIGHSRGAGRRDSSSWSSGDWSTTSCS